MAPRGVLGSPSEAADMSLMADTWANQQTGGTTSIAALTTNENKINNKVRRNKLKTSAKASRLRAAVRTGVCASARVGGLGGHHPNERIPFINPQASKAP